MRRAVLLALLSCVVVATACSSPATTKVEAESGSGTPRSSGRRSVAAPPVEDPAPDVTVQTFEGATFSLAEQRGTPVVLNFWESW